MVYCDVLKFVCRDGLVCGIRVVTVWCLMFSCIPIFFQNVMKMQHLFLNVNINENV